MNSKWIDIKATDGGSFKGYLSLPPLGKGPGLVLIQEIWGVNKHIRAVADQYAMDGYVVLAPDVFWRMQPMVDLGYDKEGSEKAFGFIKQIADGPTFAHGMTKKMLHQEWNMGLDEAIEAEAQAQAICMQTEDFRRAYEAFAAKQRPVFGGD